MSKNTFYLLFFLTFFCVKYSQAYCTPALEKGNFLKTNFFFINPENNKDKVEEVDDGLVLYPNESKDKFIVKYKESINGISIYNLIGYLVKEVTAVEESVELTGLDAGVYILLIHTVNGDLVRRITKE